MKRLLCLWLPDWPIQRRRMPVRTPPRRLPGESAAPAGPAGPVEAERPVILWHTDPRRGRTVAARCPRAAGAGVRLGMPIAQASDLARMADAIVEPYDRDSDRRALQSLAIELQTELSPQTAVETLQRFKWARSEEHTSELQSR